MNSLAAHSNRSLYEAKFHKLAWIVIDPGYKISEVDLKRLASKIAFRIKTKYDKIPTIIIFYVKYIFVDKVSKSISKSDNLIVEVVTYKKWIKIKFIRDIWY